MTTKQFSKIELDTHKKMMEDAHLGILFKYGTDLYNPLDKIPDVFEDEPELFFAYIMSRPEYFYMACKCLLNVEPDVFQGVILQELWSHKFPMLVASRGAGKSFLLAVYGLLRALFLPNRKILICSAGFRQSQIIFNYMETIINNSPVLKNMVSYDGNISKQTSGWELMVGDSSIKAIPIGDGSRIRGLRANDILADEFDSIPLDVFETVIAGFAAVSATPTKNVARIRRQKLAKKLGIEPIIAEESEVMGNQIVLAGTAGYSFRHFAKYHERYTKIIKSRGQKDKLEEIFGDDGVPKGFDHRHFSIIRLPVDILPEGFMDDSQIARAKATVHSGIYQMEYCAVFSSDSNGFFPRSIIEKCTVHSEEPIVIKGEVIPHEDILFTSMASGRPDRTYIMGVDPAMSSDNFAIVILEIHGNHRRVVYCWTTNETDFKSKQKAGIITETNYYSYCIRKIRDLCRDFNIIRIALDKDGGGRAILEGMNDEKNMKPGELQLWPIYTNKVQETDYHGEPGQHIIELVNFSKAEYTSMANHGMRKDMEEKELIFPLFDPISLAEADISIGMAEASMFAGAMNAANDEARCMLEIEELKNELCTIVVTSTAVSGRERFDTPEVKTPGGKKGRMRKDRYSALLMANMAARVIALTDKPELEVTEGGFATKKIKTNNNEAIGKLYTGAGWLVKSLEDIY